MKTVILDYGHGGILDGEYQTAGKRSPKWSDGSILYEGEFNRAIGRRLEEKLLSHQIPFVVVSHPQSDTPLAERVRKANAYDESNTIFISIHSNAGGGRGFEVYTSPGDTGADVIAEQFLNQFYLDFPMHPIRSDQRDGDLDKEANFYVLTKTSMPAVLLELLFMDNETECREILMREDGRDRLAESIFDVIVGIV